MITITNFGQVGPFLYRGAQPTGPQFAELQALGVTTVIDLREDIGREAEAKACFALGIEHINLAILGVLPPTRSQILAFIKILAMPYGGHAPICFVHCAHGEDRTGAMVACYRMICDGWTNWQAMAEAERYHINRLQIVIREFIEHFKPAEYRP